MDQISTPIFNDFGNSTLLFDRNTRKLSNIDFYRDDPEGSIERLLMKIAIFDTY